MTATRAKKPTRAGGSRMADAAYTVAEYRIVFVPRGGDRYRTLATRPSLEEVLELYVTLCQLAALLDARGSLSVISPEGRPIDEVAITIDGDRLVEV